MKKSLYLLFCLCITSLSVFASQASIDKIFIKFNSTHTVETIHKSCYDIIISTSEIDNDGIATVTISVKNNDGALSLYLFDKVLSQKELRQQYKIVVKDETCKRILGTNHCTFTEGSYCIVPLQLTTIGEKQIHEGEESILELPIYTAKKIGLFKTRTQIIDWDCLELAISIEERPDPDFPMISQRCDSIINEIARHQFCRHPLHIPKLAQQEAPYQQAIQELKSLVEQKLSNLSELSKYYNLYANLRNQLDNIQFFEVDDCGDADTHLKIATKEDKHQCKYCKMSLEQIYYELDNLYQRLDNNLTDKNSAVREVNTILKCCKSSSKHASEWREGKSRYKKGIEETCNKIKKY